MPACAIQTSQVCMRFITVLLGGSTRLGDAQLIHINKVHVRNQLHRQTVFMPLNLSDYTIEVVFLFMT